MSKLLHNIKMNYINGLGFHTDRHLVVIESDDWGSIRMPSFETFKKLCELGDCPNTNAFLSNDCLESENDLDLLFSALQSVKDNNDNPAIITANFATANPNFDKIDIDNHVYAYEPFYETYNRYYPNNEIIELIKDGQKRKIFCPQLHCREHMNVKRWMRDLLNGNKDTLLAFQYKTIGVGSSFTKTNKFGYMDAFNVDNKNEYEFLRQVLKDAMQIFYNIFGYISTTFVASCFVWDKNIEKILKEIGVKGIQSSDWQNIPRYVEGTSKFHRVLHYTGERTKLGQIYTVRNCAYEPAYNGNPSECMNTCYTMIKDAFKYKKPAIINSHRFNYINSINNCNAEPNIDSLTIMLQKLVNEYGDIEFISTPQLIDICMENKNN